MDKKAMETESATENNYLVVPGKGEKAVQKTTIPVGDHREG